MGRTLFIGDSHTCGYDTLPGQIGSGSFTVWQDNNYAELYGEVHNKNVVVYAMPGSNNRSYSDWLGSMFKKYDDIDEVIVLLSSLNRFMLAHNSKMLSETVPIDQFTHYDGKSKDGLSDRYIDATTVGDYFQLYQKPIAEDYDKFPGIAFNYEDGLTEPNIREATYMQIKTFFELNTHLEQRDFFKDVYTWDNMCADRNIPIYLFKMRDRLQFPEEIDFYGKLKATTMCDVSVETYFRNKHIDHTAYYTSDKEHYTKQFHSLIATKFLKYLTKT